MAACLVALVGCGEDAAPPIAGPSTTTPIVPTSTTMATTTTAVDEEAAVRDAHLAFLAMFEVVGDPPDPDHPELALRATGDAYDRLRASLVRAEAAGHTLSGGWDSSVQAVEFDGDSAVVVDCMLDHGVVRNSNGEVLVEADVERALRSTDLVRINGDWRVSRLNVPDPPKPCGT